MLTNENTCYEGKVHDITIADAGSPGALVAATYGKKFHTFVGSLQEDGRILFRVDGG